MKKSKLLFLGLIALLLAGGLVLASCSTKCADGCGEEKSACSTVCRGSGGLLGVASCKDACTPLSDKLKGDDY
jgi:hypothetical protein